MLREEHQDALHYDDSEEGLTFPMPFAVLWRINVDS